ncbi:MAG: DUF559 domain-containing protein [Deltaproteobacteria bacterium]|nr:DUF559 domain-containing protein [Deltaproteobacteria bacterium]
MGGGTEIRREDGLNQQGYRVIRFWNGQIPTEMDDVLEAIYTALVES